MNNTAKILTAIAAGVVTGALLGILFAPDKGSETKRKINKRGKKIAEDIKGQFRKGKEKFNDLKDEFEDAVKEKVEKFT